MERTDPGALRIDLEDESLWRGDERLEVAPKPWALLRHLVEHRERLVTKDALLEAVWPDVSVGDAVLAVAVRQLREAIGDDARRPAYIETVHRRGYRWIGDIVVRGAAASVPAAQGPAGGKAASLVGREPLLEQLALHWGQVLQGRRQVVFVAGEPGIGKTALVDAFGQWLRDHGAVLVGRGQCLEGYGSSEAYLPVLGAIEDLLRADDASFPALLRRFAPSWFAQFPWLQGEAGDPGDASGGTRERMLREVAGALEQQSLARPVALLLEDLHWADPSTVALLAHLGARRQEARLLVVGTYRPSDAQTADHPLRMARQQMVGRGQCVELPLGRLDREQVREFLERRLDGPVANSAVSALGERSSGNPLFLTHLLGQSIETGLITFRRGAWRATAGIDSTTLVPAGLRDTVQQRLDQLSREDLAVLETGSIAGAEFSIGSVADGLGRDPLAVEEACERLAHRTDLLRRSGVLSLPDGHVTGRYAFTHALVQNVLYDGIAPARRAEMHARMGLWAERNGAGSGELAHHFTRTGSTALAERAIAHAGNAAQRATALHAHEESVRHRAAALAVARWSDPVDAVLECTLQIELAFAQQRAGQIATAEATFNEAGARARTIDRPDLLARAAIGCARGGYPRPFADSVLIDLLEESVRRLPQEDHPLRAAALAHLDVALASVPGGLERRAGLAREAMAMSRRLDDPETSAWVIQCARISLLGPSDRPAILAQNEEIEALLPRLQDADLDLALRRALIANLIEVADMERVDRELAVALKRSEEAQIPAMLWLIPLMRANVSLLRGEFASVTVQLEHTAELGLQTENAHVAQLTAAYHVALRVVQGRHAELPPLLRLALAQNPNVPSWRAVLAYLCAELGELEEAAVHFDEIATDGFARVPRDSVWLVFMAYAALSCHRIGRADCAGMLYRQLLPFADRSVGHPGSPPVGPMDRFLGLLADCAGMHDEAQRHFERAIDTTARMGAGPWNALIRLEAAEALLAGGGDPNRRRAAQLLEPALDTARSLGMDGWVPRLEDALARASLPSR